MTFLTVVTIVTASVEVVIAALIVFLNFDLGLIALVIVDKANAGNADFFQAV